MGAGARIHSGQRGSTRNRPLPSSERKSGLSDNRSLLARSRAVSNQTRCCGTCVARCTPPITRPEHEAPGHPEAAAARERCSGPPADGMHLPASVRQNRASEPSLQGRGIGQDRLQVRSEEIEVLRDQPEEQPIRHRQRCHRTCSSQEFRARARASLSRPPQRAVAIAKLRNPRVVYPKPNPGALSYRH